MFRDVLYVGIGEMIKRSQKARMFAIKSHIVDDLIEYLINIHIQSQESIRTDFNKLEEYKVHCWYIRHMRRIYNH